MITVSQALGVVSLNRMKLELRLEPTETAHDDLITAQILEAVSYLSAATGAVDEKLASLNLATVAMVRTLYDGLTEIRPNAAVNALSEPFRKLA